MSDAGQRAPAIRTVELVAVAAAYAISGKLGLLLAIPPGYATAIWPPAGIALGAVLVRGGRMAPAVALGSVAVNLWVSWESGSTGSLVQALVVPVGIGIGAALQAWVGARLVRRFVGFPSSLDETRHVLGFLVLGGPVACLVNATLGPACLMLAGVIPPSTFAFSWWTWWVGDTLGAVLLGPLVLIAFAEPREAWRPRALSVALPLALTFTLSVVFFTLASSWERERTKLEFEHDAAVMAHTLRQSVDRYASDLHGIRGLFDSSQHVDREEFRAFTRGILARRPGIQALEWVPRVPAGRRSEFEAAARADGLDDFGLFELDDAGRPRPVGARAEYFPVHYVEPMDGNLEALGFDLFSSGERRTAIELARDTGQPAATDPVTLVQQRVESSGLLVFFPVYDPPDPRTLEQRRRWLRGFALGVFAVDHILEESLRGLDVNGIELRVHDAGSSTASASRAVAGIVLDDSGTRVIDPGTQTHGEWLAWQTTLPVGQRTYRLEFSPTLDYLAATRSWQSVVVLGTMLFFCGLLGAFLLVVSGRSEKIGRLVARRTAELSQANAALREAGEELERRVRERTAELKQRSEALRRSNEELEQYAYVASHDLREPLRMIASYLQLLERRYADRLDDQAREFIGFAVDGAARLQAMIRDLLAYSRVGSGDGPFRRIDAGRALDTALDHLRLAIEESGASVTRDELPELWADETQLVLLFQNLIGNSIKFRRGDGPRIHVSARRTEAAWELSVQDDGIGIESDHADRIFEIFQRLHGRDEFPGTGIGLSICKKIVQRHGGTIRLESRPEAGATFTFTIPGPADRLGLSA